MDIGDIIGKVLAVGGVALVIGCAAVVVIAMTARAVRGILGGS